MKRPRIHSPHRREAGQRMLRRMNRLLLGGSVVLTGALTEVAAHAFPGTTLKEVSRTTKTGRAHKRHKHKTVSSATTTRTSTPAIAAPTSAPQSAAQASTQNRLPRRRLLPPRARQARNRATTKPRARARRRHKLKRRRLRRRHRRRHPHRNGRLNRRLKSRCRAVPDEPRWRRPAGRPRGEVSAFGAPANRQLWR